MRKLPLCLVALPFLAISHAQDTRRSLEPASPGVGPARPAATPTAAGVQTPLAGFEPKNAMLSVGEGLRADLDDSVPLPGRAEISTGPEGDTLVAAGSGDPYFLSFAGGDRYPPSLERIDPALLSAASAALAAGRNETFAFVMFAKRMTPARLAALEGLGIAPLAFHPHYCLKVAIPVAAIDACAALDFVRWIGVASAQQKLHPMLAEQVAKNPTAESVDVWIDVSESDLGPTAQRSLAATSSLWDAGVARAGATAATLVSRSGGWQERALMSHGATIVEYVDSIRAFRSRIAPAALESLLELDFVQFVEPDLAPTLAHDESRPMVANDIVRGYYSGGNSQAVTIGEVDSGCDISHQDFTGLWGLGWDFSSSGSAFTDSCEHGTHVLGTILGGGNVTPSLAGNAPGLARYGGTGRAFLARIFNGSCSSSGIPLASVAAVMNTDFFDGVSVSPRPMAINNSWGTTASSGIWIGSEANARILDN
ncbi:MAG TPA: S8 family serine peptidase, partial [Planctomycetota bacterium]|nr:S8 family serine peptidase [Planctomycetota bacterium]